MARRFIPNRRQPLRCDVKSRACAPRRRALVAPLSRSRNGRSLPHAGAEVSLISKPIGGAVFQYGDAALALLFAVLLTHVDQVVAAREHEVHTSSEPVGRRGIGARFVHSAAQAAKDGTESRTAAREAHRRHLERLAS